MSQTVDLSQLPAPHVIEVLDYETILNERKAAFLALVPAGQRAAWLRTLSLDSEPITMFLQESAYRELVLRQRVNEAALADMLPYSANSDLDNLVANFNVQRLVTQVGDDTVTPPVPEVLESDADLRARSQQAFEGLSVAGPTAAYEFFARSSDGRVADASAISPSPACVTITILSHDGDGTADDDLLQVVAGALNAESTRPVADRLTVQSAEIISYTVEATLHLYSGPTKELVLKAAQDNLAQYVSTRNYLGRGAALSGIYAALQVEGVQRVDLISPSDDVICDRAQAAYCTGSTITLDDDDDDATLY
ncbi:baseplate J/gp47 family protein [Hafnia alvei]|uniref:baseplate J/gp47 family protein n=1 Tax=Hafnia alvei TaxID=569 RepID=UPI000B62934B|nr:baseplate J/gp47 family protein [Hafnia alvei]MBI0277270.1 baseplate J/gp47 family protein [Hafnia alvei]PNK97558.1 baseplate assembly protein [Hafnia alvei]